ncbi:MAG: hypothetical protein ACREL9_09325 [Gemmatimonadales bacterium]
MSLPPPYCTVALAVLTVIGSPGTLAARPAAQAGDTARVDTTRADSGAGAPAPAPAPLPPTPEQQRYLNGLSTTTRGVAQLKSGVDRVVRNRATTDTVTKRRAAQRLAGLCTTARDFMTRGRVQLQPNVYEDSTRLKARRLTSQVDSLIRFLPTCEANARKAAERTAADLRSRLKSYDAALKEFRAAIGLPNRDKPAG